MAKSKKLGYSEVNDLSQMSMEDLQSRFYALAQRAEQRQQPSASGQGVTAPAPSQQKPGTGFASLDLGDTPYSPDDFQSLSIEQLEEKYLDPSVLETRPEYANGATPEKAIMKTPEGGTWQRLKLSFTNKPIEEQVKYLEQEYGQGNVKLSKGKNITVKQNGAWFQLDPADGGQGSMMERALERTRDVLADNADIAVALGVGIPATVAAAPLVAAAGLAGGGLAGIAGAGALGAYGGLAAKGTNVVLGRLSGTYEATPEELIKDIGLDMMINLAGGAFVPGAKYTAKSMGQMWQKAAPNLKSLPEASKQVFSKLTGTLSGVGEGNMRVILDHADEYGAMQKHYSGSVDLALKDQVTKVMDMTEDVLEAAQGRAKDLYGKVATEAGDMFRPSVKRITQELGQDIPGEIPIRIDLFDKGVIQKTVNGGLYIDPKKIAVDMPVFGDVKAQEALKPMVKLINEWSTVTPKSGKAGVKQLLTFKERLNSTFDAIQSKATEQGGLDAALGEIRKFKDQMKSAFINKAIQGPNKDKMVAALNAADTDYTNVKILTDKFSKVSFKGGKLDRDHYASLYNSLFEKSQKGTLDAVKVNAKSELDEMVELLSPYSSKIKPAVQDINIRKSVIATDPWMRPGQTGNVQTTAGMLTGAFVSPIYGGGVFAAASPKINAKVAQTAASMGKGLAWLQGLDPKMRMNLGKNPEAVAKFMSSILEAPMVGAQTAQGLNQMLQGGGGGQQ